MCEIVAVPSPSAAIPGTYGDELSALDPSTWAVAALIEEAELTPKPALVDRRGNGAHHDLDLERLRLSAGALRDGFAAMARADRSRDGATDAGGYRWQQHPPRRDLGTRIAGRRRPALFGSESGEHHGRRGRARAAAGPICTPPAEPRRTGPLAIWRDRRPRRGTGRLPACNPHRPADAPRRARPRGTRRLRTTRCAHGHHGQPQRYLPAPSRRSCRAPGGEGGRLGRARRGRDGLARRAATPASAP